MSKNSSEKRLFVHLDDTYVERIIGKAIERSLGISFEELGIILGMSIEEITEILQENEFNDHVFIKDSNPSRLSLQSPVTELIKLCDGDLVKIGERLHIQMLRIDLHKALQNANPDTQYYNSYDINETFKEVIRKFQNDVVEDIQTEKSA